jgi:hypothetical protein
MSLENSATQTLKFSPAHLCVAWAAGDGLWDEYKIAMTESDNVEPVASYVSFGVSVLLILPSGLWSGESEEIVGEAIVAGLAEGKGSVAY